MAADPRFDCGGNKEGNDILGRDCTASKTSFASCQGHDQQFRHRSGNEDLWVYSPLYSDMMKPSDSRPHNPTKMTQEVPQRGIELCLTGVWTGRRGPNALYIERLERLPKLVICHRLVSCSCYFGLHPTPQAD